MAPINRITDDPIHMGMRAVMEVWRLVDAGFTTVRDCGCIQALHLRNAINEGSIVGPRILACGRALSQTAGHGDIHDMPLEWNVRNMFGRICDGVAEVRKAAREQLRAGADFLKILVTGGVISEKDSPTACQFSVEEIQAFVEEACNWGCRTAAHAQGTRGIKNALVAGVNSIEHGFYLDDECLDLMVKQNSFLVPALVVVDFIANKGLQAGILESSVNKARVAQKAHLESIQKAYDAGVTMGLGTDFLTGPTFPMGENAIELELYVKQIGMTPMETIVCATRNNAAVLDLAEKIGTLEPGKCADVLVVEGDPLEDIAILRDRKNILNVYKAGVEIPRWRPTN